LNEYNVVMQNKILPFAFFAAALAVALGAFGAHGLKPLLDEKGLQNYQTAVQYHFYHALALAICGVLQQFTNSKKVLTAAWLFGVGLLLFSGSLYAMSFFKAAGQTVPKWLGPVTPLGGVSFIAGWVLLLSASASIRRPAKPGA
jgi:uncharacterized membrane protein YgdD (TMEM256/DUF423 family)